MCGTGKSARAGKARDALGDQAEALGVAALVAFFAAREQHLHAEADAQHRLGQLRHQLVEPERAQAAHRIGGRADTGQDHPPCRAQLGGIGRQVRRRAEPLERIAQRRDVGAAVVDDRDVAHQRFLK
jgi:hypothetical protein